MSTLNYNALLHKARSALRQRDTVLAQRICEDLLKQRKDDPSLLSLAAQVNIELWRNADAVRMLEKCIALQPRFVPHLLDLARLLSTMGQHSKAVARLDKARRIEPGNPQVIGLLAETHERAGEMDAARDLLAPFIEAKSESPPMAAIWSRLELARKQPDSALSVLKRHLGPAPLPTSFWFALGNTAEKTGDLKLAFDAYCAANARPTEKFNIQSVIDLYRDIIKTFTKPALKRIPRPTHDTSRPFFIAGRPRSGTTLVEKILDAHPQVAGIGEFAHLPPIIENLGFEIGSILIYPQAIRDLDQDDVNRLSKGYLDHAAELVPGTQHTIDKNLTNFQMLGPIAFLFPQSKVININREAIDNCWAIFVADMNFAWTVDLHTCGVMHALYERIMRHWHEVLDLAVLDVNYEDIVADQEGWTRKIIDHCGLPWNDDTLRYYEVAAKQKDSVSAPTLSYNQVRQPIYKTSVGRAEKFAEFLGPLREGLAEGRRICDSMV